MKTIINSENNALLVCDNSFGFDELTHILIGLTAGTTVLKNRLDFAKTDGNEEQANIYANALRYNAALIAKLKRLKADPPIADHITLQDTMLKIHSNSDSLKGIL